MAKTWMEDNSLLQYNLSKNRCCSSVFLYSSSGPDLSLEVEVMEISAEREELVMQLISVSGSAHSCAIESIRIAREGNFKSADELLLQGETYLRTAHDLHFRMLQEEMSVAAPAAVTLLMVHAQDHFMNAQNTLLLSKEFVELCRELKDLKASLK